MAESTTRVRRSHRVERDFECTPSELWAALVDSDPESFDHPFASAPEPDTEWTAGEPVSFVSEDGDAVVTGDLVEVDEPYRLVFTFACTSAAGDGSLAGDRASRVDITIDGDDERETATLTLVHDGFDGETATWRAVEDEWESLVDGLEIRLGGGDDVDRADRDDDASASESSGSAVEGDDDAADDE